MYQLIVTDRCVLLRGDCAELGATLPPESVDAIVTDPPAGIGFMGKTWDGDKGGRDAWIAWLAQALVPAFQALKPGGYGLVWALPRTSHWTAMALEQAGFEIRDRVSHLFGTGFPKSATEKSGGLPPGTGTALKPACEDWWLVRKPLIGTVAANVAAHGTGVLNIDACRIGGDTGRWPANVVLSHHEDCVLVGASSEVVQKNDAPVGELHSDGWGTRKMSTKAVEVTSDVYRCAPGCPVDALGAPARFLYTAKPSGTERDLGCDALPAKSRAEATGRAEGSAGAANARAGAGADGRRNHHPTVKSQSLMRWLIRLICPPGGVVLDPFTGSGSTGVAALAEGVSFVGTEREEDYAEIAKARLTHALESTHG